jgi:hypothetical protein
MPIDLAAFESRIGPMASFEIEVPTSKKYILQPTLRFSEIQEA